MLSITKSLFANLVNLFIDAIFPIPLAEQWILNTPKEGIFKILPRAYKSPIPESFSIFSYKDEKVWRLVWSIKYKKSKQASTLAGFALHRFIKIFTQVIPNTTESNVIIPNIIVIPMPVSKQRRRERGFNQCELLTKEIENLEQQKNLVDIKIIVINNLLVRKHHTSRQTLKDKSAREKSALDLFDINENIHQKISASNSNFKNSTFIIIDDVVTTGSTMKEAVLTMRKAGFQNTWGLSVAH